MKLCSRHSSDLLDMVKKKGMYHMCLNTTTEVTEFTQRWLQGNADVHEIDPYVVSSLEIYQKAFHYLGDYVNHPAFCALCEVEKSLGHETAGTWIDNVTDAVMAVCLANGLNPSRIAH